MHRVAAATLAALVALAVSSPACGEVFVLKSGGRIEAEFLNPRRGPTDVYELKTALGLRMSLSPAQVHRVVVKSDVQKQYDEQLSKLANTVADHWQLAEWCREAGLSEQRKTHLQAILALDPNEERARAALLYKRVGSGWMTTEEIKLSEGYVKDRDGQWKTPQRLELEVAARENELAVKRTRRDVLRWLDQLDGRSSEEALKNLLALRDPAAVPAILEVLTDKKRSRGVRELCLDILGKMPPGAGGSSLVKLAMEEKDSRIRERCLDELLRAKHLGVAAAFVALLKSKDNRTVNRAAECLAHLSDTDSTLALIDALITTHTYLEVPGGGGGGLSFNSAGGFGVQGAPKPKKRDEQNQSVRDALKSLHPGTNFEYDEQAWRRWFVKEFTTTTVDLRRDE